MRIAFDARAASHPQRGGFKSYTENLVRYLPAADPETQFVFYVDRPVAGELWQHRPNVLIKVAAPYLPAIGVVLREQLALPLHAQRNQPDLIHFPASTAALLSPCPFVVTIHDTITWDERPQLAKLSAAQAWKRWSLHWYDAHCSRMAARHARVIITVSINSQQDILRRTGLPSERVRVVYSAPPTQVRLTLAQLQSIRHDLQLTERFILSLGSASPRKNVAGAIKAYASLPSELVATYQLVIVWTHGLWRAELARLVESLGLHKRVRFLARVSDTQLSALYRLSSLFVFPSLYEGFGFPPLEAMSCGTPVVASNTSSLPEVLGEAALLVDPQDTQAIARAIQRVLCDEPLRATLIARGDRQVARYSWERCARETLAVYRSVAQAQIVRANEVRRANPDDLFD